MNQPLVSVICLCYNHKKYLQRAVESVLFQSYNNIELIIVDDASTDGSHDLAQQLGTKYNLRTLVLPENQGNCKAFNAGFSLSSGKYIIDLAADDVLLKDRVIIGVKSLEKLDESYGVHFCDIELIDENEYSLGTHFKRDENGKLKEKVYDGDVYELLLEKYYISTPTMMMKRAVLEQLGGYDESLSYEDFDFWVRSSRSFKYCFTDKVLMQKHVITNSHSSMQYRRKNPHSMSTAKICAKALKLNETRREDRALLKRINYELRWALITENWEAAQLFIQTKQSLRHGKVRALIEKALTKLKPPWYFVWKPFIP